MPTSKITYQGELRTICIHLQSGTEILTDAPTDNHGKGEVFSPTDLCATSLAQCILTTIAILGRNKNINIQGATCELQKIMMTNPRRIGEIICHFKFPTLHTEEEKKFIEETAEKCPVAASLHPDIKQTLTFTYGV